MDALYILALSSAHYRRVWGGMVPFVLLSGLGLWMLYCGLTGRVKGDGNYYTISRIFYAATGLILQLPVMVYYVFVQGMMSR